MQPEGDGLNPYAAPQSDVTPPRGQEPPMPRPASTKWLLGLMWLIIGSLVIMGYFEYQARGAAFFDAFKSLRSALSGILIMLILVSFHAFKRSRITYALGVMYLLLLSYIMWIEISGTVQQVAATWNQQSSKTQSLDILIVPRLLITSLFVTLCYRFIFGLPSRKFYRLTQK